MSSKESALPPMTPPDCDLRGYGYLPFFGTHVFGSKFYGLARRNPRAGLAGIKLWWEAWNQCPAASLPNDDFDLADLAGFGEDLTAWAAAKPVALHGFTLCNDGRLYHAFLAGAAVKSFDMRLQADKRRAADRRRLQTWRDTRKKKSMPDETRCDHLDETQGETRFDTQGEMQDETADVAGDQDQDHYQDQSIMTKSDDAVKVKKARGARSAATWAVDADFMAFYAVYPRKVAPKVAHQAWIKALKTGTTPAEILAGLARHRFSADPEYVPYPASWLNQSRWADESPAPAPAAGENPRNLMSTAAGRVLTSDELFQVGT